MTKMNILRISTWYHVCVLWREANSGWQFLAPRGIGDPLVTGLKWVQQRGDSFSQIIYEYLWCLVFQPHVHCWPQQHWPLKSILQYSTLHVTTSWWQGREWSMWWHFSGLFLLSWVRSIDMNNGPVSWMGWPGARSRQRGGCGVQFCRLKLGLTLDLPTEKEFFAKNKRWIHKKY